MTDERRSGAGPVRAVAPAASLALRLPPGGIAAFLPLLQGGVSVPASVGCSLKSFLCDQLAIPADYVAERILTIFCDSRPVDDLDGTIVRDGSRIALSAAMPGLVGASMRRGGQYAALRRGISHGADGGVGAHGRGAVQVKLFNLLLSELGPRLLSRGVLLDRADLETLLRRLPAPGGAPPGAGRVLVTVDFEGP